MRSASQKATRERHARQILARMIAGEMFYQPCGNVTAGVAWMVEQGLIYVARRTHGRFGGRNLALLVYAPTSRGFALAA